MSEPGNNQDFYRLIDEFCGRLDSVGRGADARRISHLVHGVAWTSASELFAALDSAFTQLLDGSGQQELPAALRQSVAHFLRLLEAS